MRKVNLSEAVIITQALNGLGYYSMKIHEKLDKFVVDVNSNKDFIRIGELVVKAAQDVVDGLNEQLPTYNQVSDEVNARIDEITKELSSGEVKKSVKKRLEEELARLQQKGFENERQRGLLFDKAKQDVAAEKKRIIHEENKDIIVAEIDEDLETYLKNKGLLSDAAPEIKTFEELTEENSKKKKAKA